MEASMIDRRLGEKPVHFEISLGKDCMFIIISYEYQLKNINQAQLGSFKGYCKSGYLHW